MPQMILPNQGEIKEIFPWIKKEANQKQEGHSFPFQNEPSFKNVFAKINQGDEQSGMSSAPASVNSMEKPKEETPYDDEYGIVSGGLVNKMEEDSDQNQEVISSPVTERENTPDHGEKEVIVGVNLVPAIPIEKAATESTLLNEKESRFLQGVPHPHPLGHKEGNGAATSLHMKINEGEHPTGSMAEKVSFTTKGEKGEINLAGAATNKQEQPSVIHGKGNVAEEVVSLAGDMKKGAEAKDLFMKDGAVKETGDTRIAAMSSSGADTKHNSNDAKQPPFAFKPLSPEIQENQGKTLFATSLNNQNAGMTSEEELIISGKESASQGNVSGAAVRQVYTGDRVAPKGAVLPMERIIHETGNLLEKGGKVQLILHPPNLGKINMEVIVRNNRVELMMTVNNTDVQQVLQASSDQLRNALQNQGFQFDQMSVLLKRENLGSDSAGGHLWQNEQQEGGRREKRQDAVSVEKLSELGNIHYDETKNISIFV